MFLFDHFWNLLFTSSAFAVFVLHHEGRGSSQYTSERTNKRISSARLPSAGGWTKASHIFPQTPPRKGLCVERHFPVESETFTVHRSGKEALGPSKAKDLRVGTPQDSRLAPKSLSVWVETSSIFVSLPPS